MSTVQEIEAVIPKLSRREVEELRAWVEDYLKDHLELTDEVKAQRREISSGQSRYAICDVALGISPAVEPVRPARRINIWHAKALGFLRSLAGQRSVPRGGTPALYVRRDAQRYGFRSSVCALGDYGILYEFDVKLGKIYLHYVGHRREIYKC